MPSATPVAPKHLKEITQHGQTRVDNYFWMRYKEDPAVLKYLHAESDYLEEVMQHTNPLQEKLFLEMKGRIKETDTSAPVRDGQYIYYIRTEEGKQYPIYCRKPETLAAPEEILLDQNVLAEGKPFCRIGAFTVSPDDNKLAYSIDPDGSEKCVLYIKDLTTGSLYPEVFENTHGSVYDHRGVEWANDSRSLFYMTLDAAQRAYRVHRHVLGTSPAQDVLLFEERDELYSLILGKTRSDAYITIYSHAFTSDEWLLLPADQPESNFTVFQPRMHGLEYFIAHLGERFFVATNENAENFKLMEAPVGATTKEHWREVIPHRPDTLIEGLEAFENFLVIEERRQGLQHLRISAGDGVSNVRYVEFPEPVYMFAINSNPEFETPEFKTTRLRFSYSSLVTPKSDIDYHMDSGRWEVIKEQAVHGYDKSQYVSERLFATAPDGTQVPMSIVYRKGLKKDRSHPCLLYSYGSYGASTNPYFRENMLSLIDRGFVYALGHIRGGSEMGRHWYEDGKMMNKRNTFTDFIACAEHIIKEGYTSKEKLAIQGGSAGGLLVGACMTMRPDLYKAVIAKVPFMDVINTMSDPSIPLTTMEWEQWGNPKANKEHFDYMMSYSPYDNLRPTAYPNILITTGLNDPRVAFWEPTKFTAKLRALKTDDNLVLLKTNYDAGHAGASGRYDFLKEIAFDFAFLMDRLGVKA